MRGNDASILGFTGLDFEDIWAFARMESIQFDPEDPYPNVPVSASNYRAAQLHAREVDRWLNLPVDEIESTLHTLKRPDEQAWIGLSPDALQTPYCEFRSILEGLRPRAGDLVIDLGAAYGRLGLVMAKHFPESRFLGFELIEARVESGRRIFQNQGLSQARLECLDLEKDAALIPPAQIYFIYDFGSKRAIAAVLERLRDLAQSRPITVVGRGRAIRDRIERDEPWLSQVIEPRHGEHSSVYRSG